MLAEGDIVPADADVVDAAALLVDEAALADESVPVDKTAGGPGGRGDVVAAGTVAVRGHGRAVVTATGAASSMGRVAALLGAEPGLTPLQRRLAGVGRVLAVVAVALCAIVLAIGLARAGRPS
jgi:Ca2+-transporting ATPase